MMRLLILASTSAGNGNQSAFSADYRNRDNGLIYRMNEKEWKAGKNMDFSHADAVDSAVLNQVLWQDCMGATPMPAPQHNVFASSPEAKSRRKAKENDLD